MISNQEPAVSVRLDSTETFGDLLPQQFYDILTGPRRSDGPRDLMLAVLEDGIRTYVTNVAGKTTRQRRLFDETKTWFDARGDRTPFSFETICETLDIDAENLRRRIGQLSPNQFRRRVRSPKLSTTMRVA